MGTGETFIASGQGGDALRSLGYFPYVPFRARQSPFWMNEWTQADIYGDIHRGEYAATASIIYGLGMTNGATIADSIANPSTAASYSNLDSGVFFTYQPIGRFDAVAGSSMLDMRSVLASRNIFGAATLGRIDAKSYYFMTNFNSPTGSLTSDAILDSSYGATSANTLAVLMKSMRNQTTYASQDFDVFLTNFDAEWSYSYTQAAHTFKNVSSSDFASYGWTAGQPLYPTWDSVLLESSSLGQQLGSGPTPVVNRASFSSADNGGLSGVRVNIASRMSMKEALHHAQCAYFVSIVIVQWADLTICKTRMNSVRTQGMLNAAMDFGLMFETILACIFCYTPYINTSVTRPIRFSHWFPGIPFAIFIFVYDECRKLLMRRTTKVSENAITGQVERDPGWLERNTYY